MEVIKLNLDSGKVLGSTKWTFDLPSLLSKESPQTLLLGSKLHLFYQSSSPKVSMVSMDLLLEEKSNNSPVPALALDWDLPQSTTDPLFLQIDSLNLPQTFVPVLLFATSSGEIHVLLMDKGSSEKLLQIERDQVLLPIPPTDHHQSASFSGFALLSPKNGQVDLIQLKVSKDTPQKLEMEKKFTFPAPPSSNAPSPMQVFMASSSISRPHLAIARVSSFPGKVTFSFLPIFSYKLKSLSKIDLTSLCKKNITRSWSKF
jgi:hypothetical protein